VAQPGQVLENPVTGERVVFRRTTAETGGELLEYDLIYRPQGFVTRPHVHPRQEERHEVVEGALGLVVGRGAEQRLDPGDAVVVPAGTTHRLFPIGDEPVHVRFTLRPALRTEELLETFVALARDGKLRPNGMPGLLDLAVIARDFEDEGYATRPPLWIQRALLGPLAALGRRRGLGGAST
jgi:mannose-6-phosphate isomerase-like protein (cupin superfamily)